MSRKILLFVSILGGTIVITGADRYEEDLYNEYLQLQVNENRVLAFYSEKPSPAFDLEAGERVMLNEEKGYIGAVMTNRRFLAISTASGKWLSEPLGAGEENSAFLKVGDKIAMLITDKRIIGFTLMSKKFIEYDLPLGSKVKDKDTGENFGIVAMSDRAVGLSSATGDFSEIKFDMGETFKNMEMATTLALINTEDTIYTFRGSSGTWTSRPKKTM